MAGWLAGQVRISVRIIDAEVTDQAGLSIKILLLSLEIFGAAAAMPDSETSSEISIIFEAAEESSKKAKIK